MPAGTHYGPGPPGEPGQPAGQSRARRILARAAWPVLAVVAIVLVGLTLVAHLSQPARHTLVVASMPYWNLQHDTGVVLQNRGSVNEVSPWIYGLSTSGAIKPQYGQQQAAAVQSDLSRLRAAHLAIVPSIANVSGGAWDYQAAARILHDPALAAQRVNEIAGLAERQKFAGIDLDFEQLHPADRQAFTRFVTELAGALHAHGKVLSVAVFPQVAGPSASAAHTAQDYAALGKVADQVRIMGYNDHWASSGPGATAPIGWVRSVLKYATSQMPASKVVLGIPLYGYDWPDGKASAETVSWLQALRLSRQHDAAASYDKTSQAPHFTYTAAGRTHTVWFENAESSKAKFEAVQGDEAAGVYLWMYGYEDPGTWPALKGTLPLSGPNASSTSKAVP
jgi:spore germination protein